MLEKIQEKLSIYKYFWKLREYENRQVLAIQQKTNLSEIISRILVDKNIPIDEIDDHINPTIKKYLPDPLHFLDMDIAAKRIAEAVIRKQKIIIFGDYDVDGATSSALLKRFFDLCNIDTQIYIPNRVLDGYGPNSRIFRKFKEEKTDLVITVDCGTTSFEAFDTAHEIGLDSIIIDHHIGSEVFPKATAIVNPNRIDETSPHRNLAAVGVVFMVTVATLTILKKNNYFRDKKPPNLLELLDLVAVGTICDVVALENINRAFVVQGLKILAKRSNVGLSALFDISGLNELPSVYHLGYVLGPRINAGGRIGESKLGAELLSTNDPEIAKNIAAKLNVLNKERRAIENIMLEQAIEIAEKESSSPIIFIFNENWHSGVIGIIASRLKERYNKPTSVLTMVDGLAKASCRSIIGIDYGAAIVNAKALGIIENGGGHAMAAGFTIKVENIEKLKKFLEERFHKKLMEIENQNTREFNSYITVDGINESLARDLEKLGPFGSNNPQPKFCITDAVITKAHIVANSHINFYIKSKNQHKHKKYKLIKSIIFRATENNHVVEELMKPFNDNLALIGNIKIAHWNGSERVEFILIDAVKLN